jgi:hypothetical protein
LGHWSGKKSPLLIEVGATTDCHRRRASQQLQTEQPDEILVRRNLRSFTRVLLGREPGQLIFLQHQ